LATGNDKSKRPFIMKGISRTIIGFNLWEPPPQISRTHKKFTE